MIKNLAIYRKYGGIMKILRMCFLGCMLHSTVSYATLEGVLEEKNLVSLCNVSTEQQGQEFKDIEKKPSHEQFKAIVDGMGSALEKVIDNKDIFISIAQKMRKRLKNGGRVIAIGAGTSGRLAAINSREAQLKFPEMQDLFHYAIAGGSQAFTNAVEGAEDNIILAQEDAEAFNLQENDVVLGLSASGRTPYAVEWLKVAKSKKALAVAIANSPNNVLSQVADESIVSHSGPECPRGSTRMKAGTSQLATLRVLTSLAFASSPENDEAVFGLLKGDIEKTREETSNPFLRDMLLPVIDAAVEGLQKGGRIVYTGTGLFSLLGAVDGAELNPTYSLKKVAFYNIESELAKIQGHEKRSITDSVKPNDILISLEEHRMEIKKVLQEGAFELLGAKDWQEPASHILLTENVILKVLTTMMAIKSGWVLEGEMVNLDPSNPNKKLVARRVEMLIKYLKVASNEEDALKLLDLTKNHIPLAVLMRRKNISLESARDLLEKQKGNVLNALNENV